MSEPRTERQQDAPWEELQRRAGTIGMHAAINWCRAAVDARHAEEIAAEVAKRVKLADNHAKERQASNDELRALREQLAAVQQALRMLRNESHGIRAMSYDAIKDSAGYTNLKVWTQRIEEADATIAALSSPSTPEPRERDLENALVRQEGLKDRAEAELTTLRGAMAADDERLRKAGERVGVVMGCDTADWMAEQILTLRESLQRQSDLLLRERAERDTLREQLAAVQQVLKQFVDAYQLALRPPVDGNERPAILAMKAAYRAALSSPSTQEPATEPSERTKWTLAVAQKITRLERELDEARAAHTANLREMVGMAGRVREALAGSIPVEERNLSLSAHESAMVNRARLLAGHDGCTNGFIETTCVEADVPIQEYCKGCLFEQMATAIEAASERLVELRAAVQIVNAWRGER